MKVQKRKSLWLAALTAAVLTPVSSSALSVRVTIENLAPSNGTFLTPLWVGFHNGTFDIYDQGVAAFAGLEAIAEDGNAAALAARFSAEQPGGNQGMVFGPVIPPIAPGETASAVLNVDPSNRYFSYASMIIPSNDAFIANGHPMAFGVFTAGGSFLGTSFVLMGSHILDAGTEVNDELPANTAFFGQAAPNTGVDENGVVHNHPGFNALGTGGILDDPRFSAADFEAQGYVVARITISSVPDAGGSISMALLSMGALSLCTRRNRQAATA